MIMMMRCDVYDEHVLQVSVRVMSEAGRQRDLEFAQLTAIQLVYPLSPRQNDGHFADDIFKCAFSNESFRILMKSSLKCFHKGQINNKSVYTHHVLLYLMKILKILVA